MVETAYITDCGGRKENEDAVRVVQTDDCVCAVVADGLGGYGGGQVASSVTADTFIEDFQKNGFRKTEQMTDTLRRANELVISHQSRQCEMKSTLVVLVIHEREAKWMHVGDSRLYHFKNASLVSQTLDHSVSQLAVMMKEITQEEIRFHEDRSKVLRALGSDSCEPEVADAVMLEEGFHAFLLCTDGFWEYVYEQEMTQLLSESKTPEQWLRAMEKLIRERAPEKHDNYSAAAVFVV
jgi:serine/threonine protein phosphatase PrpC